ncbi:MAG: Ig domain protein group 2 domain protein [Clostridia bacterium]|jgi:hypothetical protein|nr:Ig domain protein group 2 domain protein [Clostridia bacterium]
MFYNILIKIYSSPDPNSYIKSIYADVQPYLKSMMFEDGFEINITKRVFCDIENSINIHGNEIFDKSVAWSIRNQDGTSTPYASITASTGNSATVKAASSSAYLNKYVVLKATLSDDSTVFKEFNIQIKSLL